MDDLEQFVFFIVTVPDKLPFQFGDLHILVIHAGDHLGRPMVGQGGEGGLDGHGRDHDGGLSDQGGDASWILMFRLLGKPSVAMPSISNDNAVMARNLDTALLRSFLTVADHASMTAAARILNLTQGAVSQQIARLETMVGAPLFVRDRSGLRLTALGERLMGKARRLLALNDDIWDDITGGAIDGPVRIGVPYDLVAPCIAPMLRRFAAACPQVDLSLVCGSSTELAVGIADGSLDLAVVEESVETAGGEHLMTDRLVWVGARGGLAHGQTPLPLSLVVESCIFRPVVLSALRRQGREWRTLFENGGLDATFATVRMDLAVSAWLAFTVPSDLEILPMDSGLPGLPSFAVTLHQSARPPSPAVTELARHLRDAFVRFKRAG